MRTDQPLVQSETNVMLQMSYLLLMIINYRDVFSLTKLKGRQQVEYAKGNNDCITFTKGEKNNSYLAVVTEIK